MVIAAAGEEAGAGIMHHQVEAEQVAVEGFSCLRIADAQMDMAHPGALGHTGIGRLVGFAQQLVEIEPLGRHGDAAIGLARPFLPLAVAIDFDAVALGIGEIERLADEVVGGAFERDACHGGMPQPVGEIAS